MRAWVLSLAGHGLVLWGFFVAMPNYPGLTHLMSEKKTEFFAKESPIKKAPQATIISEQELQNQITYISQKEQQYLKAKDAERQALDRQLLDLSSERQRAEKNLNQLRDRQQELQQEIKVLSDNTSMHEKAYLQAKQQLEATEKEIKHLQLVQSVTAEVYQEKIKTDLALLQSYRKKVSYHLARYWNLPNSSKEQLKCQLRVKIIPNGEVVDVQLLQSSGESVFDNHAIDAVYRSSPLPVLDILSPQERPREIYMTFIPQDITAVEAFS